MSLSQVILLVIIMLIIGMICREKKLIRPEGIEGLQALVMNFTLPISLFYTFYRASIKADTVIFPVTFFVVTAGGSFAGRLLCKLVKEKDLLIADEEYAKEMLKRYSYYSLISGYKDIFKNTTTKTYKKGTRFEDIVNLYEFDASLRELFLKYLLRVEWEIKSLISYHFCEKFGENQVAYLNINNYNTSGKNRTGVQKLVNVLNRYTSRPTDYNYINHAQNKYHNVPLWVLVNALTFGNMSKMYFYLPFDIQTKIAKNYPFVNEMQLAKLLAVTAQFRNICAHGERLYSYKTKNAIPDFPIHDKLGIIKKGKQYE